MVGFLEDFIVKQFERNKNQSLSFIIALQKQSMILNISLSFFSEKTFVSYNITYFIHQIITTCHMWRMERNLVSLKWKDFKSLKWETSWQNIAYGLHWKHPLTYIWYRHKRKCKKVIMFYFLYTFYVEYIIREYTIREKRKSGVLTVTMMDAEQEDNKCGGQIEILKTTSSTTCCSAK